MSRRLGAALICAFATTLVAERAEACSCSKGPDVSFPKEGQPAPRNTKLWLSNEHARMLLGKYKPTVDEVTRSFRLKTADARELDYEIGELVWDDWMTWFFVVTPKEELEPGEYSFGVARESAPPGVRDEGITPLTMRFEVVDERWLTAPAPPELTGSYYQKTEEGMCGGEYVSLSFNHRGTVLVMDLGERDRPIANPLGSFAGVSTGRGFALGTASCMSDWDFDKGPVKARVGAFDLAGNFSGWSKPKVIDRPPTKPPEPRPQQPATAQQPATRGCPPKHGSCACQSLPVQSGASWPSGAWAFASCAALLARYRRRQADGVITRVSSPRM